MDEERGAVVCSDQQVICDLDQGCFGAVCGEEARLNLAQNFIVLLVFQELLEDMGG